jgi:glutathione peroxidase-family protein
MKILVLFIYAITSMLLSRDSFYDLEFRGLNGDTIRMRDFAGKKLIVNIVRSSEPEPERLLTLKNIYFNAKGTVDVLLIPVTDFDLNPEHASLKSLLTDSLELPFKIAAFSKGKRSAGDTQHLLIKWLNDKSQNKHFDDEIQDEPRMFVISESGVLFADLKGPIDLSGNFFKNILLRQDEAPESPMLQSTN